MYVRTYMIDSLNFNDFLFSLPNKLQVDRQDGRTHWITTVLVVPYHGTVPVHIHTYSRSTEDPPVRRGLGPPSCSFKLLDVQQQACAGTWSFDAIMQFCSSSTSSRFKWILQKLDEVLATLLIFNVQHVEGNSSRLRCFLLARYIA